MSRGTVARYGDVSITDAIVDGMAAAKLQREIDRMKIHEAQWGVHDANWRKGIMEKIEDAEFAYGDNRVRGRVYNASLGLYGLIVWTIHSLAERLKAMNREA